jgi:hypothetical protein
MGTLRCFKKELILFWAAEVAAISDCQYIWRLVGAVDDVFAAVAVDDATTLNSK